MIWVAIKVQTTGLLVDKDEIVSVSSSTSHDGVSDFFCTVQPTIPSSTEAERVHKISAEQLKCSIPWTEMVNTTWAAWFRSIPNFGKEPTTLVAHNGIKFDFAIIRSMHKRYREFCFLTQPDFIQPLSKNCSTASPCTTRWKLQKRC